MSARESKWPIQAAARYRNMCECQYSVSLTLLTALCVLSGVVRVVSPDECETAGAGNGVDVQATCYPNGSVTYNWNSDPRVYRLQIEYQCFFNGTPHEQTPERVEGLGWADIKSGYRTRSVQPWKEGTLCFFSGCYESRHGFSYSTYHIPDATCTVHTVMTSLTMSSSPVLHMASMALLPTPSASPDPTHSAALHHARMISPALLTSPAILTSSVTTRSLSPTQTETSTTVLAQPADFQKTPVTDLSALAVVAVLFVVAIVCVIAITVPMIISLRQKRSMWDLGMFKSKEMLDATYNPVSLQQCKIAESSDTLLEPLERPKLQFNLQSYEYTPRAYIKHAASDPAEKDASLSSMKNRLSDILMSPDGCSNVTESANCGATVDDNDSVNTLKSMKEERNEVVDLTETWFPEKEEEEEKVEGREMRLDGSGYIEGNSESLESTKCQFELPVGEFPLSEPFEFEPSCGDTSSGSFCIDDGHLHSFSHKCADTSRSSGYISNQTAVS